MLTDYVKNKPNSSRPRPLFRDSVDVSQQTIVFKFNRFLGE